MMKNLLSKKNNLWLLVSLISIFIFSSYIIWQCFIQQFNLVNFSVSVLLIIATILSLVFFLRSVRHQENIETLYKKNLSIITTSEEFILLTDNTGSLEEIIINNGSEKVFGSGSNFGIGQNIFRLLGLSEENSQEMIYQLQDGEPVQNKILTFRLDKDISREVLVSIYPLEPLEGKYVFFVRDLSWFKKLQNEVLHTEKMAGIGKLAADIAHQLNTPLGSILLSSQLLIDENNKKENQEDLEKIIRQTKRCKDVVKNLLDLSRKDVDEKINFYIKPIIERSVDLLTIRLKTKKIKIKLDLSTDLIIYGNPADIEQTILNLLMNSIDAMPDGGKLSVRSASYHNRQAIIYVEDNGKGIDEDIQSRIFDPFFSTKKFGEGTGLGLAMSRQIVEEHGGTIVINSKLGKGAMVCITLPLIREKID